MPWIFNGNEYNGWSPGLMLYSGFIPTLNYGISVKPMWDFKNNRLVGSAKLQKTFNQLFGFRSLTVSANYSDYEGRKGAKFNFNGLIREPIVSQPATRIKASVYTHDIDRDAVASRYYSSGKYLIGDIGINYYSKPSALLRYTLDAGLTSSFCKNEFSKLYATGNLRWRNSKKGTTYLRGWFGHFLNDKYIPRQYRNYLGGGVDPNFETAFVLNRMNLEDNTLPAVFESQYIEDGAAMRGLAMVGNAPLYSTETSWGLNLTQSIRDVPIEFFADFAGGTDLNDSYIDAGLLINLQSIKIYLPFYQSWDEETFVKDFDWIKERIRFEIAFDLNSLSF